MLSEKTDLLIIGGGPIGLACGVEAQKQNLRYVILEKGCLANSLYHYPKNMNFFSTSEKLEIGSVPFVSNNPKPSRTEALEYYRRAATSWELNIKLYEQVMDLKSSKEGFKVTSNKGEYQTQYVILATGFYDLPKLLGVEGESLPKVQHYFDEPHFYFNTNVAIVGAANSAVDAALEIYRKGAKSITMVIRGNKISPRVKYWVKPDIDNRIEEGSIKAYFDASIQKITPSQISIQTPHRLETLDNDFVLALSGYQPNFVFLEKFGVKMQDDINCTPIYDDKTMESNVKNIFLAGVICGGLKTHNWFIENSIIHSKMIVQTIMKRKRIKS